jgi:hypothetical protein
MPSKVLPLRITRTQLPDPTGRSTGRYFPHMNLPVGPRIYTSKRCVVSIENKERVQHTGAITVTFSMSGALFLIATFP